jgi:cell division septation protein DedD
MLHHIQKSQPSCYDDTRDDTYSSIEEPVSPERDEPIEDQEHDLYEDVPPRSIFAATWFRVVLVVIVLGVAGAVAVPYVLDWMNPPLASRTAATTGSPPLISTTPTVETMVKDGPPGGDKLAAEKKDSTVTPAPAVPAPARSEPKGEPRPGTVVASTRPPAESKPTAKAIVPAPKAQAKRPVTSGESKDQPAAPTRTVAKVPTPAAGGSYWVQIGAFKDAEAAKRVATKLREQNFKVEESVKRADDPATAAARSSVRTPAPVGTDQYDVFVTGLSVEELNRRLAGKGLAAETAAGGGGDVVVKPSLPLRDAVALSKDLAVEGFKVQVRRSGAAASAPAVVSAPSPAATQHEQALHRVRVGVFTDRAAAVAAARELESKGFRPYIARGDQ